MNESNEQSMVIRVLSKLLDQFFGAFAADESGASVQQMNAFMSYTSGFWMMDAGYVGDYYTVTEVVDEKRKI